MDELKICINCRFIGTNGSRDASRYRCFAEQNKASEVDWVTGEVVYGYETCYAARASALGCGKEAQWFEPKPPAPEIPFIPRPEFPSIRSKPAIDTNALLDQLK